jgi:hypothetical protein
MQAGSTAMMMARQNTTSTVDPSLLVAWHSAYWADSSDMNGYANGANVTTWFDQIGAEDLGGSTFPVMVTTDASFNNHKSVQWTNDATREMIVGSAAATGSAQPVSIVVIGKYDSVASVNNSNTMFDGGSTSNRLLLRLHSGPVYAIFSGTTLRTGGTPNTSPHCFMARFNNGANTAELEVDGVNVINAATAGSHSWDGFNLGYATGAGTTSFRFDGRIVFAGVYFGDVEADGGWATFKTWVGTYYGITVA